MWKELFKNDDADLQVFVEIRRSVGFPYDTYTVEYLKGMFDRKAHRNFRIFLYQNLDYDLVLGTMLNKDKVEVAIAGGKIRNNFGQAILTFCNKVKDLMLNEYQNKKMCTKFRADSSPIALTLFDKLADVGASSVGYINIQRIKKGNSFYVTMELL